MRIVNIAAAIAMSAVAAIACGQGMPANSLSKSPGTAPTRAGPQFYSLPAGAYVMAYGGQQLDATVTAQAQGIAVSFGGFTYSGSIAANTNHFVSTQMVMGHPAIDGNLTANGVMSGRYLTTDPRGAPRPPADFTLTMKGAGATISSSSGQKGIPASTAAQQTLNPPASPPPASAVIKPGDANSLNPQPLPPKPEPNWGAKPNAPSPRSSSDAITNTGVAGPASMRPVRVGEVAAKRFREVGLDPASAAFTTQLRERIARANAAALKAAAALPARESVPIKPHVIPATAASSPVLRPRPPKSGNELEITAVSYVIGPYYGLDPSPAPTALPLPGVFLVNFTPPTYVQDARRVTRGSSLRIVIPDCGIDYTHSVAVDEKPPTPPYTQQETNENFKSRAQPPFVAVNVNWGEQSWPAIFPSPIQPNHDFDTTWTWDAALLPGIGAGPRLGRIVLTSDGSTDEYELAFQGNRVLYLLYALVGTEPPFLGMGTIANRTVPGSPLNMPLDASQGVFGNPGVERVNYSDQVMEGEDVVGAGVVLGAGWQFSLTKVAAVWSMTDTGDYRIQYSDQRRSAVLVQPPDGRLDMRVKWSIAPGESLGYLVEWNLYGPQGQRPLSIFPTTGPCDS
jgi:hypothetical protein